MRVARWKRNSHLRHAAVSECRSSSSLVSAVAVTCILHSEEGDDEEEGRGREREVNDDVMT